MCACSVSLDNAPYVKILSHVRLLGISTHSDQGNGRRFHFELVRDWDKPRSLVTNAVRRGPSSSVSAVNFNPSPLPGFTCRTTASALIFPSSKRKSSLIVVSTSRAFSVSTNKPPILRSRTREVSSLPLQFQ